MAKLTVGTGVDALLVGDSLGMVVQGGTSTLPVTLDEIIYHTKMVRRGAPEAFIIADMPFGSIHTGHSAALASCIRVMKESGASAVKFEGAEEPTLALVQALVGAGVPVMGHLGLTPQRFLTSGGYKVQGRGPGAAARLLEDAKSLQKAGAFSMVLELVVESVAREVTDNLQIPTIGIGSGGATSGQVLVLHDLLGLDPDFKARHVKRYADLAGSITRALSGYAEEVHSGRFPSAEHSFQ